MNNGEVADVELAKSGQSPEIVPVGVDDASSIVVVVLEVVVLEVVVLGGIVVEVLVVDGEVPFSIFSDEIEKSIFDT